MSREKYEESCAGCRPVLLDARTRKPLPADCLEMRAVQRVFDQMSAEERETFHAVTCRNSRDPEHLRALSGIRAKMADALRAARSN